VNDRSCGALNRNPQKVRHPLFSENDSAIANTAQRSISITFWNRINGSARMQMAVAAMARSSVDFVCSDIESSYHIAVNTEQNPEISFNNDRTDRMSSESGQTPDDVCT